MDVSDLDDLAYKLSESKNLTQLIQISFYCNSELLFVSHFLKISIIWTTIQFV